MPEFTEQFLCELKSQVRIETVLAARGVQFRQEPRGGWFLAHCVNPGHEDKKPSMKWKERDDHVFCFSCNWTADVFEIIRVLDKVDFRESVVRAKVHREGGESAIGGSRPAVDRAFQSQDRSEKRVMPLSDWDKGIQGPFNPFECREALDYMHSRGLTDETVKYFKLAAYPRGTGWKPVGPSDPNYEEPWIGIPYTRPGQVFSVKYRCVTSKAYTSAAGMAGGMFNANPQPGDFDDVYLTSGEFDAMVLWQAGFMAQSMQSDSRPPSTSEREALLKAARLFYAGDTDKPGMSAMNKIGMEIKAGRILRWPEGIKDANEAFISSGSVEAFAGLVTRLTAEAAIPTPPGFTTLNEQVLLLAQENTLEDDPNRFRFPWPKVDEMIIALPGHVITVSSSTTGTGKSTFVLQSLVYNARLPEPWRKSPAIYCAEQSPDELARMTVACLGMIDKSRITPTDVQRVMGMLDSVRFYLGYDPSKTRASEVLELCEGAVRHLGVSDLVIDNMGFVGRNEQYGNLYQAQANAMARVKNIAKEIGVRMWVLCSALKQSGPDKGKFVAMNDTAGTAAFEDDADHAITLHRKYLGGKEMSEETKDIMEPVTTVVRKKSRWPGPGNAVTKLVLLGAQARFAEYTGDAYDGYNRAGRDRAAGSE